MFLHYCVKSILVLHLIYHKNLDNLCTWHTCLGTSSAVAILNILATSSTTHLCRCFQAHITANQPRRTARKKWQNFLWLRTFSMLLITSVMTLVWQKARHQRGLAQLTSCDYMFSIRVPPGLFWTRLVEVVFCLSTITCFNYIGLRITCLSAVTEIQSSNVTTDSCVYHNSHCDIQPLAWAVHAYCGA